MQIHELFGLSEEEFNAAIERANILTTEPEEGEKWGRLVRHIWVGWAEEQPNPKPSWLDPYEKLPKPDQEADRRIGAIVAAVAYERAKKDVQKMLQAERERLAAIAASVHVGAGEAVRNG